MNEKKDIMDLQLEAQIELDSTFTSGEYNLVFNVVEKKILNFKNFKKI